MRPVRPTIRVLVELPLQGFDDPRIADMLRRKNRTAFDRIDQIRHAVLDAARASIYNGHRCQHHVTSTNTAGQRVFEVEESSSGWRGAVILDEAGDPWLVYADAHDRCQGTVGHPCGRT